MNKKIEFTKSCGNVFADLDLKNADFLLAKSRLAQKILEIIELRKLTQSQAAKILGTHQSQISRLKTGEGKDCMSFDLLLEWLNRLDLNVTLSIQPLYNSQKKPEFRVSF